jgi:hypothetical protein
MAKIAILKFHTLSRNFSLSRFLLVVAADDDAKKNIRSNLCLNACRNVGVRVIFCTFNLISSQNALKISRGIK